VHVDETGWRQGRHRAWLWVMVSSLVSVFVIHARRSTVAARCLIGECEAIVVSDRWSAYSRFTYLINLNSDFAPGDLLLPPGGGEPATGLFFERQNAEDLAAAIRRFESGSVRFEPKALRRRAEAFDRPLFMERMESYLASRWREHARC